MKWTWKEGFYFALSEDLLQDGSSYIYKKSKAETLGSALLKPIYKLARWASQHIQRPHIIILATLVAVIITLLIFYEIPALLFFGKIFPPQLLRFLLFVYFELSFFAAGCKAFGRFNNKKLVAEWKAGKLIAVFPGDKILK